MGDLLTILAGTVLLSAGLYIMRFGLNRIFSHSLRNWLQALTQTPWRGLLTGTAAAAIMQGSTAVTLSAIGLVSAGYLSFSQALGLVLGANIGTCATVQILTLSSPPGLLFILFALSTIVMIAIKKSRFIALAFLGLIIMFYSINLLTVGLKGISELETAISWFSIARNNPLYGIIAGILITFLVQSSSAATGLLMALYKQGLIDLTIATYGIYGNNIGSCLSSLLVGAIAPLAAKRLAVAHFVLNLIGVVVFLPFTAEFVKTAVLISNNFPGQVAAIHTLFNIISSLAAIIMLKPFSHLIIFLVPDKTREK